MGIKKPLGRHDGWMHVALALKFEFLKVKLTAFTFSLCA